MTIDENAAPRRSSSGRWIVIGMFAFGIAMTGAMWVYWYLHLAPFFPLQKALADEFPKSVPRVEGGRHKKSPPILRIVLQVPFSPKEGDPQVQSMVEKIISLARRHQDLARYEKLEIYLVRVVPEKTPERLLLEFATKDLPPPENAKPSDP